MTLRSVPRTDIRPIMIVSTKYAADHVRCRRDRVKDQMPISYTISVDGLRSAVRRSSITCYLFPVSSNGTGLPVTFRRTVARSMP